METATGNSAAAGASPPPGEETSSLRGIASRLADKHQAGPAVGAGGRPDGATGSGAAPAGSRPGVGDGGNPTEAPPPIVDPAFVREMLTLLGSGAEAMSKRRYYLAMIGAGADKELAAEVAETFGSAPPGAIPIIANSGTEVLQQYGLINQHTPLGMLVVALVLWVGKDFKNRAELRRMLEELKKTEEVKP